jgi:hypothetical protein
MGAAICTSSLVARADTTKSGCTVGLVAYTAGKLNISCSPGGNGIVVNNYAVTSDYDLGQFETTCRRESVDTLKRWATMAESALISGRPVDITVTDTSTTCNIKLISAVSLR